MATHPYYSKHRATKAAKFTVIFRAISTPATIVGSILLVRLLSEEQYGLYNLFYALLPAAVAVLSFGLDNTVSRYIPEFVKDGEFRLAKRLRNVAHLIRLITSGATMLAMVYFWDVWSGWLNISNYRAEFTIFAAILLLHFQYSLLSTILASYLMQKYSVGARAGVAAFKAVGYAYFWACGGDLVDILLLELGIFAFFTISLFVVELVKIDNSSGRHSQFGPASRRRIMRYAAFYNFNDVGALALGPKIDNFFIAAILNPIAVGAYSLATMISSQSRLVNPVNFFDTVIKPVFFSLDRNTQADEVTRHFQLLVKITLIFSFPVAAFFVAFNSSLVSVLFAGKFQDYSYLIGVVICFALVSRTGVLVSFVAQLAEKAGIVLASKLFVVYNVLALLWLIPRFGILGAAIATGTAAVFKETFIWWHVRELASFRGMGRFFAISLAYWIGFVAMSLFMQDFIENSLAELVMGTLLLAGFTFLYMRLPLTSPSERQFLRTALPERAVDVFSRIGVIV